MEYFIRFLLLIVKVLGFFVMPIIILVNKCTMKSVKIPPVTNDLLKIPAVDLANKIRNKEVTSEEIVCAYIKRIKEVNTVLNAVASNRFDEAILDARKADQMIQTMPTIYILTEYPLLGVPFTVKESCSLKGLSYCVGSPKRKDLKAEKDGEAVANFRAAGAIPLCVTNTPEYCYNWESNNYVNGRSLNPFNTRRSPGGSSGGEGALVGAGASLFGVSSDVAGSIRIPAMFNGVFGHKPTGGLISLDGHFPYNTDERFMQYLVIGPIARYARDLPLILSIMAGKKAKELRLEEQLYTKDIKIFYLEDAGFSFSDIPVDSSIKIAMWKAIKHFEYNKLDVKQAPFDTFQETFEMSLANLFSIKNIPNILENANEDMEDNLYMELMKCVFQCSKYTFPALIFMLLVRTRGFVPKRKMKKYIKMGEAFKQLLLSLLGDDGVLFYPTYPISALHHNQSPFVLFATMYTMLFNWLGFPSTHVPLGKDKNGMPIGIQVAAAPMQDRLCLCIAGELEAAFGGWKFP